MDNDYETGALCQFITSKRKRNITNVENKKKNVKSLLHSEINSKDLSANEEPENYKKKSKKKKVDEHFPQIENKKKNVKSLLHSEINSKDLSANEEPENYKKKSKKKKVDEHFPQIENKKKNVKILLHSEINSKDLSANEEPENYKKKSKKKKVDEHFPQSKKKTINMKPQTNNYLNQKSNDVESNDNSKTFGKKNSVSKLSDIKSSAEYIEKESRTVFVGNVSVDVKMSVIKNVFKKFGEIESMRLRNVAVNDLRVPKRVSIIKKNFHPQRSTANVYICYKTIEQAENALQLNATQLQKHTIRVDMALNTNHKQYKKNGLFIGNLPYGIQEDELWDFFKDHGPISAVRVVRDNITGVSKGFGYIDFEKKESVELAMQLQGKKIQGREIRIQRIKSEASNKTSVTRKPMSFKKKTTKPPRDHLNYQGVMELKTQKKKPKPTKADLIRRKIAKQLNT